MSFERTQCEASVTSNSMCLAVAVIPHPGVIMTYRCSSVLPVCSAHFLPQSFTCYLICDPGSNKQRHCCCCCCFPLCFSVFLIKRCKSSVFSLCLFNPDEPVPPLPRGQEPPAPVLPDAVSSSSSLPMDGSAAVPEGVQ